MFDRPKLLDLFCGAGGCAAGYQRAGFYVIGVDKRPQPRYCGNEFHQADAIDVLRDLLRLKRWMTLDGTGLAAVHASPPCQRHSAMTVVAGRAEDHPELVGPTRDLLRELGLPFVIENVERAPLINPVTMCATTYCPPLNEGGRRFRLRRHRLFETNFPLMVSPCSCASGAGTVLGIYGGGARSESAPRVNTAGGNTRKASAAQSRLLMETPWMTKEEMNQAIPPAFTEHIGGYLMQVVERERVAA